MRTKRFVRSKFQWLITVSFRLLFSTPCRTRNRVSRIEMRLDAAAVLTHPNTSRFSLKRNIFLYFPTSKFQANSQISARKPRRALAPQPRSALPLASDARNGEVSRRKRRQGFHARGLYRSGRRHAQRQGRRFRFRRTAHRERPAADRDLARAGRHRRAIVRRHLARGDGGGPRSGRGVRAAARGGPRHGFRRNVLVGRARPQCASPVGRARRTRPSAT